MKKRTNPRRTMLAVENPGRHADHFHRICRILGIEPSKQLLADPITGGARRAELGQRKGRHRYKYFAHWRPEFHVDGWKRWKFEAASWQHSGQINLRLAGGFSMTGMMFRPFKRTPELSVRLARYRKQLDEHLREFADVYDFRTRTLLTALVTIPDES